jgi:hypothetical protein
LHIVNVPEDMVVSSTPFVSSRRDRCKVGGRETQSHNGDLIKITPFRKAYTAAGLVKLFSQSLVFGWAGGGQQLGPAGQQRESSGLLALGRIRAAAGAIFGIEA